MIEMQTKREKLTAESKIIPPNPEDKKFGMGQGNFTKLKITRSNFTEVEDAET